MTAFPAPSDIKTEVSTLSPEAALILPRKICFVCTGNTCRSPMAAAVANVLGKEFSVKAVSAGLFPNVGEPISENALNALLSAGFFPNDGNRFDLHTASMADEKLIAACDRIVAISRAHLMTLISAFPAYAQKMDVMPHDISDPYGGDEYVYKCCLEEIIAGVKELLGLDTEKGRSL